MDELDPRNRAIARLLADIPIEDDPATLERVRDAYRHSRTARRGTRRVYRHGMRLATVTTVSILTGSLAAGYAAALPDPVQRAAHHIFGGVGVPAPHHQHAPAPAPASPRPSPDRISAHRATPPLRHHFKVPSPPGRPQLQLTDHGREPAGSTAIAIVTVHPGRQLAAHPVQLQSATTRTGPWRTLLTRTPDHSGHAVFAVPALSHNTWLRAVDRAAISAPHLLFITPTLTGSWVRTSDGQDVLRLVVRGAAAGETIMVSDIGARGTTKATAVLDRHGDATITYTTAPAHTDRLIAQIASTRQHDATTTAIAPPPTH